MALFFPPVAAQTPVTASGTITTTSTTDVVATGMTSTPTAGTYLVFFTGSVFNTLSGVGLFVALSVWSGGAQVAASQQQASDTVNFDMPFTCVAVVTVDGTQAIEGRWRCSAVGVGTASMTGTRTLNIIRVS